MACTNNTRTESTTDSEQSKLLRRFSGIEHLIGNTPLLVIDFLFHGQPRRIFAKSENLNMTGSIKDRMALHILRNAYLNGTIQPGDTIVEATSGNTGIAFCAVGRALGHPVKIFMPNWMSKERVDLIRSFGAEVISVTVEQGGFLGSIQMADEMGATQPNIFLPHQFANEANIQAHVELTGPEIWWQLQSQNLTPDAFVAGVGTGGTVMGVGRYLKSMNPKIQIHPLEPGESPTLRTGYKNGKHRIQGISDEFIPAIVQLSELDEIVDASDGDAIIMSQKLACELGLAVGISSGANFIGALKIQEQLGADSVVVTVFSDDNKKYLSTDLMREEPVKPEYLSPHIQLTGFQALRRACQTCGDYIECRRDC